MYRPAAFEMTDDSEIRAFIDAAGPAHLVTLNGGELTSNVVPLLLDRESNSLVGHLARANPQWQDVAAGVEALAIFSGPDGYISPSFYPTKQETGKVVPTWNYEVVHASGEFVVHDDVEWVTALVTRLTERHESKRAEPWSVDDTPEGFIAAMAKAIVGIEIRNLRLVGKRKLSQNRSVLDIEGTIAGLEQGGVSERELAKAMRANR